MVYKLINLIRLVIYFKKVYQGEIYNPFFEKYEEANIIGKFYVEDIKINRQYRALMMCVNQDKRN